jgi:DNA-binding NarL/FixJ family response regulator
MRILLAEHHSKVLRGLRMLIGAKTDHVIAGEVVDWESLREQAKETKPDLVLLDWDLPGCSKKDLFAELQSSDCRLKVIVLSTRFEVREKALEAGADAFVSKGDAPEKLLAAIKEVN